VELHCANFGELAETVNGINESVFTAENFHVRLFSVTDEENLRVLSYSGEYSFDL
jgi:hypothetical protein